MIRPMNPALYRRPRSVPVLVLVDMQQEYEVAGRPLALPEIAPALENCRLALNHARESGIQVAYVRWIGAPLFQAGTRFARWIEGFEPHGCDMIFDRDRPSCFASPAFADVMERGCPPLVVAGFAGEAACLATAIDGYHRGQEVTFLADASASHDMDGIAAADIHRSISAVMRSFADVTDTHSWIAASSPFRPIAALSMPNARQ
ncbi:Peroxyureidoacrylate/ureidoacrylate amidohydrolase RutB [Methylobacterium tardum]|jgi:nicotinamidase-related amidase|uniref:Amidase n=1 Tax=Methylobacterium tardum TaxID=374432 RepID=A0AA37WT66_9HYPH|nr:cysteine hydrolase [Methylobacterium tardum]URD34308.1 cysteine hydrolase [Methylobacterium tardum]GJE48100.1 Peroxyureidoacrylate/ureidoacrylate amidohydrolase RutB [Methylobacterium tardum]GLS72700.1 amidase [Methylobacterium tardum]